jgi:hypothetical protein
VLRAERRLGELSRDLPTATGNQYASAPQAPKQNVLRAAGIKHQQASEYERLAAIPDEPFAAL